MDKILMKLKLRELCSKERNIYDVCSILKLNEYEVLALVRELRTEGINIITKVYDDDIYLFDLGEIERNYEFNYNLSTDFNNEFPILIASYKQFS